MISIVQYWGGCPQVPNSKWCHFLQLLTACAAQGWRTGLVWSRMPQDPALSRPFQEIGCEIFLLPRPTANFSLSCIRDTWGLLRRTRCTIFHCHNVHTSPLIAAAIAGTPVRMWSKLAMSPYYEKNTIPRGIHRLQLSVRVSGFLSTRVLCISTAVRDELKGLGLDATRLLVETPGIDCSVYSTASENGLKAELGLPADAFIITTVGHADPVKGWDILIRAFSSIASRLPSSHLLLVGGLDNTDVERHTAGILRSLVHNSGIERRIHFLGQRKDIPRVLAASHVFAFPSRSEGLAMALLEAMAAGLPCVAARVGGIPDVLVDECTGLTFERESVEDLAGKLLVLLSDPQLRRDLSERARQRAWYYSLEQSSARIVSLYQRLLAAELPVPKGQCEW